MLDLVSSGQVEFGIGASATGMELGGFHISAKQKRALSLEAAEQIADMMALDPCPGYDGHDFSTPARNVLPKPSQKPHPPMWLACTNRATTEVAARNGLGALAFSFVDPDEVRHWADASYSIIRSPECRPLSHRVDANIAMVAPFSLHRHATRLSSGGIHGFRFFNYYAMGALLTKDNEESGVDQVGATATITSARAWRCSPPRACSTGCAWPTTRSPPVRASVDKAQVC